MPLPRRCGPTTGPYVVRLFPDQAPKTVRNFVELAEGGREWTDPKTGKTGTAKLYDGTIFHRVIPEFMIQGGDPLGRGTGGPGYEFADEFGPDLSSTGPTCSPWRTRVLAPTARSSSSPRCPRRWLNRKHTIFGEVISGSEIVDAISKAPTGRNDRPVSDVVLESVADRSRRRRAGAGG